MHNAKAAVRSLIFIAGLVHIVPWTLVLFDVRDSSITLNTYPLYSVVLGITFLTGFVLFKVFTPKLRHVLLASVTALLVMGIVAGAGYLVFRDAENWEAEDVVIRLIAFPAFAGGLILLWVSVYRGATPHVVTS